MKGIPVRASCIGVGSTMPGGTAKTFVGFGFGPVQTGLFLYEARESGNFKRFVIAEVDGALVEAVATGQGRARINIARRDRIDRSEIAGIEIYNPRGAKGREAIVEAVAESDEMATALPSVDFYDAGEASPARLIAEGFSRRARGFGTIIYTAENHNRAAEILRKAVLRYIIEEELSRVEMLNTVIGKMGGVIADGADISRLGLATLAEGLERAVLVEEFNRILISRVDLEGYRRGIKVFVEKDDLVPFEEAKLYGHNAIHALIAYLADWKGLETIAEAGRDASVMETARRAFVDESGAALVKRHGGLGEEFFTEKGYRAYAEDLMERMVRPTLHDGVARVGRDHLRKLSYDDRLFGTMRLALLYGIEPVNLARGAAAGVLSLVKRRTGAAGPMEHLPADAGDLTLVTLGKFLTSLWGPRADKDAERLIALTWEAAQSLLG